ncbi:MAG: ATP-binding protein [Bacteroidales bacterium]
MGFSILKNSKSKSSLYHLETLSKVSIFEGLSDEILREIALMLKEYRLKKGTKVFAKGDFLGAMYVIVEGSVVVHDGEHIFASFGTGDFFGEYSLIDSTSRSATVTTIKDSVLLRLEQKDFDSLLRKYHQITRSILNVLINRLRQNNILEEKLTQHSQKIQEQRDELEEQRKSLTELNATKDKFFTIIAHDLKNPFNTVIGLSDLLLHRLDSYNADKIREFVSQINRYSNGAYALLENLLQWAKTQTGRMEMFPVSFSMHDCVASVVELYRMQAQEKAVSLHVQIDHAYIKADANMVSTVMRNLLSNAIKFTPRGGRVKIYISNESDTEYTFVVEDNGIGMEQDEVEKLFKIDSHFSTPGTDDEAGTGIGLILAKEFVQQNNGTISVDSTKGEGTRFIIQLPKAPRENTNQ